jgi:hypothetical protein
VAEDAAYDLGFTLLKLRSPHNVLYAVRYGESSLPGHAYAVRNELAMRIVNVGAGRTQFQTQISAPSSGEAEELKQEFRHQLNRRLRR